MAIDYLQGWQAMDTKQAQLQGSTQSEAWVNGLMKPGADIKSIRDISIFGFNNTNLRHLFTAGTDSQVSLRTIIGGQGSGFTVTTRFFIKAQPNGITTVGARLRRNGTTSAQCVRLLGTITSAGGDTGTAYIGGTNTFSEVYVEVEINWDTKKVSIYLNDVLNGTLSFTALNEVFIGSNAGYPVFPPINTASSVSWAFGSNAGIQYISDIYANYDAADDESPVGRLGPVVVRPIPLADVAIANGEFFKTTKEDWLARKSANGDNPQTGIRTAGDGKKTVVTFDDIEKYKKDGESIVGFGITQLYTNFDPVKPTKLIGNISGPSGKDYSGSIEANAGSTSYSNPLSLTVAVNNLSDEDVSGMRLYMDMTRAND